MNRPAEFDTEFVSAVRGVMIHAYNLARDHYDPDIGVDGQIFSFAVYKIAARLFEREFADWPGTDVVWNGRGREIVRGGKRLRWNKIGTSARDEIRYSFPSRSRSAHIMAEQNLEQLNFGFSEGDPDNWIIAHAGNPADGLQALYLAAPIEASNGRVSGWLGWLSIYDADHPNDAQPVLPTPGPIEPTPVDLPEFDLALVESDDAATNA
jgi:hypothetical protein